MFTYPYHQPDEYHFSLDSIHFAEFVAEHIKLFNGLSTWRVLDLCAGCGVIGIELSWYCRALQQIDFVEVQEIYTDYFEKNTQLVNRPDLQLNWFQLNYEQLILPEWAERYDLIVSNPPYFQAGHGMLSPSSFKNRCRFFLDSSFEQYIRALANTLADGGLAYFLLRPLKQHGLDLLPMMADWLNDQAISMEVVTNIRKTDVVLLRKNQLK